MASTAGAGPTKVSGNQINYCIEIWWCILSDLGTFGVLMNTFAAPIGAKCRRRMTDRK